MIASFFLSAAILGSSFGIAPPVVEACSVEYNDFGAGDSPRMAILFRDYDGEIMAWRWYNESMNPAHPRPGVVLIVFSDAGKPVVVRCKIAVYRRSEKDIELEERARFPEHLRKGLK